MGVLARSTDPIWLATGVGQKGAGLWILSLHLMEVLC